MTLKITGTFVDADFGFAFITGYIYTRVNEKRLFSIIVTSMR